MSDRNDNDRPDASGEDITADLIASTSARGSKKSRKGASASSAASERPVEPPPVQEPAIEAVEVVEAPPEPAPEPQVTAPTMPTMGSTRPERRGRRRALISAPVRVRQSGSHGGADEVSTTLDVSRSGILFINAKAAFTIGMEVSVTFPYSKSPVAIQAEQNGRVTRISPLADGRRAVAVALHAAHEAPEAGRKQEASRWATYTPGSADKPLVLAVDADRAVRDSLKGYLSNEGYEVIAVSSCREAHEVLDSHTPALVIAEIEGENLPGYDLCAHVKATPRLQAVPVMLMTRSAYPSDYANAHSLGAVVCMAKPYRQERLGHVVRLLAPPPQAAAEGAPRQADPSRRPVSSNAPKDSAPAKKGLFGKAFRLSRYPSS